MKTLECLVIDDVESAATMICRHIEKTAGLNSLGYETNPVTAVEKITKGEIVCDLVFLDMEMPQMMGDKVAEIILPFTHIIFVSGHDKYAIDAFDAWAVDFLHKPATYQRFLQSIMKAREKIDFKELLKRNEPKKITLKGNYKGKLIFLNPGNITHVNSVEKYVQVCMIDSTKYLSH